MKRIMFWALATCVAAGFAQSRPARADGLESFTLTSDNGYDVIGINAKGEVAIESPFGCSSGDPNRCYQIFDNGVLVSESDALTGFTADDGNTCAFTSTKTELQVGRSVCNGGNQVVGVRMNGQTQIVYLSYTGNDLVTIGTADLLFVNTAGDFVVVDGLDDEIREFTPTPEPGTLILLATAMLGIGAFWYRRQRVQ